MIKTGECTYSIVAEWIDMDPLAKARPNMTTGSVILRDTFDGLSGGIGKIDPFSRPAVPALKQEGCIAPFQSATASPLLSRNH